MHRKDWPTAWVVLACACLTACGGGGGGGGTPPSAPTVASLLPTPPALGDTLEADATALLPQVDGANWRFWGRQKDPAGNELARYETVYTLSRSGGEWVLHGSNGGNDGADDERFEIGGGELRQVESVQFLPNQPAETLRYALLRSPVRVGDQTTILNKHFDAVGDLDGDGKFDAIDLAAYVRVIGKEDVTLASGDKVPAVKVETHLLQRPWSSKTGQPGPVDEIIGIDWFAKGLGWVRRQVPVQAPSGLMRSRDEQLVAVDAGEAGVGAGAAQAMVSPADSPEQAGQPLTASFPNFVRAKDRILVVTQNPVVSYPARQLLTLLDKRGRVLWTRSGPSAMFKFAPLGDGFVGWRQDGSDLYIQRLDERGQPLSADAQRVDMGGDPTLVISHDGFQIAADDGGLWVAAQRWERVTNANGVSQALWALVVRGFDRTGQPLTAPISIARGASPSDRPYAGSLTVSNGAAVLAWSPGSAGNTQIQTARVTTAGAVLAGTVIDSMSTSPFAELASSASGMAMHWNQGGGAAYAWLDDGLVRSGLDGGTQTVLPNWSGGTPALNNENWSFSGEQVLHWGMENATPDAPPTSANSWLALRFQSFQRGKAAPVRRVLLPSENGLAQPEVIGFSDRLLVLNRDGSGWRVRVVWL